MCAVFEKETECSAGQSRVSSTASRNVYIYIYRDMCCMAVKSTQWGVGNGGWCEWWISHWHQPH